MEKNIVEEVNYYGFSKFNRLLSVKNLEFFKNDILDKKDIEISNEGIDLQLKTGELESLRDLTRFGGKYLELIEDTNLNLIVNSLLNDKAIIHSYNGIITKSNIKSEMMGHGYHRDQPYFKDRRTSILIMIPLVDYNKNNGATEYVPGTHLFEERPSSDFLEKFCTNMEGKAGDALIFDSTVWHRAGKNTSNELRPMIVIKYTLAPFKQQFDFCKQHFTILKNQNELIRQRFGWNSRVPNNKQEFLGLDVERKWKSGQYDMKNTKIE